MIDIVVAAAVALLLVVVVTWAVRRRGGDEEHSVEGYRHALDTLSGIRSRSATGSVRVLGQEGDARPEATGAEPPGPAVFEDTGLHPSEPPPRPRTSRRRHDRAMSAMNRGPRRLGAPILAGVVVLAALAAVIVVGARSQHHPSTPARRTAGSSHPATTVGSRPKGQKAPTSTTTTTTTTLPPRFAPVTATATTATYRPPASSYTLTLVTTTGGCWVTVSTAGGQAVLTQTIPPGQSRSLSLTGTVTVIIGAPTVLVVNIDHEAVTLPTGFQTPFTMTLAPAAG